MVVVCGELYAHLLTDCIAVMLYMKVSCEGGDTQNTSVVALEPEMVASVL